MTSCGNCQSVVLGPAAPGNLLEVQILWPPHLDLPNGTLRRWGPAHCVRTALQVTGARSSLRITELRVEGAYGQAAGKQAIVSILEVAI